MGSLTAARRGRAARSWILAPALAVALASSPARAADCPVPAGADPRLASAAPEKRVAFISRTLDDQARRASTWSWSWAAIGTAVVAGNYVFAGVTSDHDARVDAIISGSAALAIPVTALLLRLRVEEDAPQLRLLVDATDGGRVAPCLVVERAEELLARDADDQRWNAGWFGQGVAIVTNGALALILGAGLGHWGGAAFNGIGGLLLSEAQIFTQPTGAARAWERYRAGGLALDFAWTAAPSTAAGAPGIGISFAF